MPHPVSPSKIRCSMLLDWNSLCGATDEKSHWSHLADGELSNGPSLCGTLFVAATNVLDETHTISRRRPQGRCLTNGHKAAALSFLPSLLRKKVVVVVVVVLVVVVLVVVSFSLT
ncbi:unnamed protein product [Polarella glacialis]|uniref:Uncharacterized protein n=1 Tax=Polarella glacialis TaxID=89957 RepID=A0A813KNC8_POLGL|nr:unnamed protein product [Polarella glacialis]